VNAGDNQEKKAKRWWGLSRCLVRRQKGLEADWWKGEGENKEAQARSVVSAYGGTRHRLIWGRTRTDQSKALYFDPDSDKTRGEEPANKRKRSDRKNFAST